MPEPTSPLQVLQDAWKRFLIKIGIIREETFQIMEQIEEAEKRTIETDLAERIKKF